MPINRYDQASRYQAKIDPPALFAWLLQLSGAFVFRRWLDTRLLRFPGEPDRICDTVAFLENVAAAHFPWAIVVEFQIEPDPLMFGRLLGYFGPLWLTEKPSPEVGDRFHLGAIVVNLTGRGKTSRVMKWPEAGLETSLQIVERDLETFVAAAVLQDIEDGKAPGVVLPWIPLMQGGGESGIIEKWKELAGREADARRRGDYAGLALVFADAAGRMGIWKTALEGWNMRESQAVLEWQAEAKAEDVLKVLETRLGTLPADLPQRVGAIKDIKQLDRLLVSAARCASWDEFQRDLSNG
jgi:hypothetical protein